MAYLINGARLTVEGYPIIEKWMVSNEIPGNILQWDKRNSVKDKTTTAISFYCNDQYFQPVISNPRKYLEKLSQYQMVLGMDASPYDNMPLVVQRSQIFVNLAVTYYFGRHGLKIIPNIRVGSDQTMESLSAYPCNTLISIGTNGFVHDKQNVKKLAEQVKVIADSIHPSGILVYGTMVDMIFNYPRSLHIPIYEFESYIHKRRNDK